VGVIHLSKIMSQSGADVLNEMSHRPWPVPHKPWNMYQSWYETLFIHWKIPIDQMRTLVPDPLEIDTFDGNAWLGIVPFRVADAHLRHFPRIPFLSDFPELNVRTYVKYKEKPGVYFFSLEAPHIINVELARLFAHLPYMYALMTMRHDDNYTLFESQRFGRSQACMAVSYGPNSNVFLADPGTVDHWLTERYCLYTRKERDGLFRQEIHHAPWPLQRARAMIGFNTMLAPLGLETPVEPPLLHYAAEQHVVFWSPEKVI
jgi:uncharacterized protein YqjF (DUF2071 family)